MLLRGEKCGGGGGGSLLTVSLKSCGGEPGLKTGGGGGGVWGGVCCAPVGGVCLSQRLWVDIKKRSASMLQRGDTARSYRIGAHTPAVPERSRSHRTYMDGQRKATFRMNLSAGARNFWI